MTREEELDWLCRLRSEIYVYMPKEWLTSMNNALDMAIIALEQEPCEDCISRQAVFDIIRFEDKWLLDAKGHNTDTEIVFNAMMIKVSRLPSVKPQEPILDKIRAEIMRKDGLEEALEIIDKYKSEMVKRNEGSV